MVAGVGHGDDLGFLFPMSPPGFPKMITTAAQRKTRANLLELLESFSLCGMPKLGGVELWERVGGNGTEEYLEIGETVKMVAHPTSFTEQLHFWRQVNTLSVSSLYFQYIHPKHISFQNPLFKGEGESGNGEVSTLWQTSLGVPQQNCHRAPLMMFVSEFLNHKNHVMRSCGFCFLIPLLPQKFFYD